MSYTLVLCEKPDAARRIALALGTKTSIEQAKQLGTRTPVFDFTSSNNQRFVVCSALGHLYNLVDVAKNRSVYPVFDLVWKPKSSSTSRNTASKASTILDMISGLSKDAKEFVHACDYDQEGEVIGYNILQYACKGKYNNSLRAKFSTLTDEEIRASFDNLMKPNKRMAEAGTSRHILDFFYGVNLSRALAQSFKKRNSGKIYRNLSIGRVQGPSLAFVVDRELEVRKHIPDPYWTIMAEFDKNSLKITAFYEEQRVKTLTEAKSITASCIGEDGIINEISDHKVLFRPPTPFDLGNLQREAYRLFKISPSTTLAIAERLYLEALVSYPRTSSQKLPKSIGYEKIISNLSRVDSYRKLTLALLARNEGQLVPNEGSKDDPAHPAIYPTGVIPRRRLRALEFKVYDLVVKRFLATFGDAAVIQRTSVRIRIENIQLNKKARAGGLFFKVEGSIVLYEGWIFYYKPYFKIVEVQLPQLSNGDILKCITASMEEKITQPPNRFNQASLLEKMDKEQIGTKATRANVISTLFKRNYIINDIKNRGIKATDLGLAIVESMNAYVPGILHTNLTKSMEKHLSAIQDGTSNSVLVIEHAVDTLIESLSAFKEQESHIGQMINQSVALDGGPQEKTLILGICPVCKIGKLRIIRSRKTKKRFVGCTNYYAIDAGRMGEAKAVEMRCRATAPLPQRGTIVPLRRTCQLCSWPIADVVFSRRSGHWKLCINVQCPSKKKRKK